MDSSTFDKLVEILADIMEIDPTEVNEETTFDEIAADSLDLLEVVTEIEDVFGIEVDTDSIEDFQTIGDVVAAIDGE